MKGLSLTQHCTVLALAHNGARPQPLLEQIEPYIAAAPCLLLDVAGVEFDSGLVGEVIDLCDAFRRYWGERPHRLGLVRMPETGRRLFTAVHLNDLIPIYPSVDAALEALEHRSDGKAAAKG